MKNIAISISSTIKPIAIVGVLIILLFGLDVYTKMVFPNYPPNSLIILWLAVILFFGKLSGVVERYGHPAVLGELIIGALFGNLLMFGIGFMEPAKKDSIILFLTQLGSIILFFQAGLAIDLVNMRQFFKKALLLAVLGLLFSVGTYYFLLPILLPGESQLAYIYFAFALSPTGAGVTARVMQDLEKLHLKNSQFIISSGALDNIICFTIQAMLIAYAQTQALQLHESGLLSLKVLGLIAGILLFCIVILPLLTSYFASLYPSRGLKFAFAFSIGLFSAFSAQSIGISPVIGAFLAGVAINPQYFAFFKLPTPLLSLEQSIMQEKSLSTQKLKKHLASFQQARLKDLEEMFVTPAFLLVSVFFVVTGMSIDFRMFTKVEYVIAAIIITIAAFATKMLPAFIVERKLMSITGIGMSPRGVTTLVFAAIGKRIGLLSPDIVTLIILTVMITTFITPLILTPLFKKLTLE